MQQAALRSKMTVHWTTKDELAFLAALRRKNPLAYERYVDALGERKDWGAVNCYEVFDYVTEHRPMNKN